MEQSDLLWFHVPGFTPGDQAGSPAVVKARVAGRDKTWPGIVNRSEGKLDERTRMVNVVVRVENPYEQKPPMGIGLFVTVEIRGDTLTDAAVIPRSALRQDDVVWVVDGDNTLHFRNVEVARADRKGVVIRSGLENGDRVVFSSLKVVTDGMEVRPAMADFEEASVL